MPILFDCFHLTREKTQQKYFLCRQGVAGHM